MSTIAEREVRVPRLRPCLGRLWYRWLDQLRLARISGLIPSIMHSVRQAGETGTLSDYVLLSSKVTQSGVVLFSLRSPAGLPRVFLKVAYSLAGNRALGAQEEALVALRDNARLGDWRALLPASIATGEMAGHYYSLQGALPGVDGQQFVSDLPSRRRLIAAAASKICVLHGATSMAGIASKAMIADSIGQPTELIRAAARSQLSVNRDRALALLEAELRGVLDGRPVSTSWIHGDYWLGNVLVERGANVTGVVDWCMAAPSQLPLHDVLHLILQTRQMLRRQELGDVVRAALSGADWEPHERSLLDSQELGLPTTSEGLRAMVLLYWLRRLRVIFEQDLGHATNTVWLAWNVDRVLQCL